MHGADEEMIIFAIIVKLKYQSRYNDQRPNSRLLQNAEIPGKEGTSIHCLLFGTVNSGAKVPLSTLEDDRLGFRTERPDPSAYRIGNTSVIRMFSGPDLSGLCVVQFITWRVSSQTLYLPDKPTPI